MYIARLKDEKGYLHEIQEEVIMELWSRLAERGYWKQPEDSMYDMATEKEWIEHIEEGMDPEKVESIVIYRKDDGEVKKKVGGVAEEEMAERLEALMDKKEKEELRA